MKLSLRQLATLPAICLTVLGLSYPAHAEINTRSPDTLVEHALTTRITQGGLDYIALLLEKGLEANNLRGDIVRALEGQVFRILMPQFGGYAVITVDYGEGRPHSDLDGFRYDDVTIELSSIPLAPRVVPESGVVYPALTLNRYKGNLLPELHVFISYDPFIPASTPISAVAEAILVTSGVLRPSFDGGDIRIEAADFETNVFQMNIKAWSQFPPGVSSDVETALKEALGQAVLEGMNKEVNDALSGVFMSGLNDILFDRDRNGEPDKLLSIDDLITDINNDLDAEFAFLIDSRLQSNPVTPAEVFLDFDATLFAEQQEGCLGQDAQSMRYTLLERDGNVGHDPAPLAKTLPDGREYQLGLSISDDFVNSLLHAVYMTGRLCLTLSADDDSLPEEIRDLLTTTTFESLPQADWLYEAVPDAPLRFELVPYAAPYIEFPDPGESETTMRLRMPALHLDVLAQVGGTWMRVVGYDAELTASVIWEGISLSEAPFLQLDLAFDARTTPIYGELISDADPKEVRELFPTLLQLAGSNMDSFLGGLQFEAVECLEGISVGDFNQNRAGVDGTLAHYLQIYINLEGIVDLGYLLSQCLLEGESLAGSPAADFELSVTEPMAHIAVPPLADRPLWVSVNGLPRSYVTDMRAQDLFGGRNRLVYGYTDGRTVSLHVLRDETPPHLTATADTVALRETAQPTLVHWEQFNAAAERLAHGQIRGAHAQIEWATGATRLVARNGAGLSTAITRPQGIESDAMGCASSRARGLDGTLVALVSLLGLRLSRRFYRGSTGSRGQRPS